jgi:DNA (cytosine-5)-methyltransferase 1
MTKKYFVDLFGGAGGFSEGLKQAGFEHVVGVEMDPLFAMTYAANHGSVIVDDVRNVTREKLLEYVGDKQIELVAASPPCQSFSTCGPRKIGDPKDTLFEEVVRIVGILNPKKVILENVTGLLTKKCSETGVKYVDMIMQRLKDVGYHAECRVLASEDYEVPQKRRRVIIIAALNVDDVKYPDKMNEYDRSMGRFVNERIDVPKEYFLRDKGIAYFARKPQYVRYVNLDKPCNTIRACYAKSRGADAAVKYEDGVIRMLTERECATVQTFPESYVFKGCRGKVYQQIGNAIPVNLAKHVGMALLN